MKKILKLIIAILILLMFSLAFQTNNIYAQTPDDMSGVAGNFIQDGAAADSPMDIGKLRGMSDTIYNFLLIIAIIVAVIVGLIIAIKFITGSVSEKAKIKETLIPYIAGCVVIFGAFTIWKLIIEIMKAV